MALALSAMLLFAACGDKEEVLRPGDNEAVVGGVLYGVARETYLEPDGAYFISFAEAQSGRLFTGSLHLRLDGDSLGADLARWDRDVYYDFAFAMDAYCSFTQTNTAGSLHTTFDSVDHGAVPVFVKGKLAVRHGDDGLTCEVDGMLVNSDEFRLRLVVPQRDITQL